MPRKREKRPRGMQARHSAKVYSGKRNEMPFPPAELPGIDALRLAGFFASTTASSMSLACPIMLRWGQSCESRDVSACSGFGDGFRLSSFRRTAPRTL
jgi:hypothetical protein